MNLNGIGRWFQSSPTPKGEYDACRCRCFKDVRVVSILTHPKGECDIAFVLLDSWTSRRFNPHPPLRVSATSRESPEAGMMSVSPTGRPGHFTIGGSPAMRAVSTRAGQ